MLVPEVVPLLHDCMLWSVRDPTRAAWIRSLTHTYGYVRRFLHLAHQGPGCCAVVVPFGQLDAKTLKHAYDVNSKQRLQLHLRRSARGGQPEHLPQVPVYAHVRVRARSS